MANIVIKVGGSCLKTKQDFEQVSRKIKNLIQKGLRPILVVSAVNGTTNSLLNILPDSQTKKENELRDSVLAEGEILSAKILAAHLSNHQILTETILPNDSNWFIVTNNQHGDAEILANITERKAQKALNVLLAKNIVPVIPGFIGITLSGKLTTLGRGGSDTTAIAIGNALHCKEIILLKDVEGICAVDPKKNKNAKVISNLSPSQAIEISLNGGKVVHHKALALKRQVSIRVVSKDKENILSGGTLIEGVLETKLIIGGN
ncbi:MAG: hypothetical protein Q7S92_01700 [Candidatus Diapherotrites archaeon]|nr:hypothetical protein [Candidatus Diapherotrites archaeon]